MFPEPATIITFAELHRGNLLASAGRESWVATTAAPALAWRTLAMQAVAFVAVCLGIRS